MPKRYLTAILCFSCILIAGPSHLWTQSSSLSHPNLSRVIAEDQSRSIMGKWSNWVPCGSDCEPGTANWSFRGTSKRFTGSLRVSGDDTTHLISDGQCSGNRLQFSLNAKQAKAAIIYGIYDPKSDTIKLRSDKPGPWDFYMITPLERSRPQPKQ
jgi:hypothetical protein